MNRAGAKFCISCGMGLTDTEKVAPPSDATLKFTPSIARKTSPVQVQIATGRVMNNRYTILRALGKGGMGKVYLASETIANRTRQVVVKEMLEYFDPQDPEGELKAQQRFESEAATLVGLNFASIPQIFDFFSEAGRNYIVMQFIEGRNLEVGLTHLDEEANLVPGKPYPVESVREWGIQISKVLEKLSVLNIVHMDVKPPNLILDKSGDVWLVDFGTAKARWFVGDTGELGIQKSSVYGTVGYAPPEQYSGKAEPRSDVYALASTLYHLVTNDDPRRHPFSFPRMEELPADIAIALKRALEKDVNKRVTASEFRQLLSEHSVMHPLERGYPSTNTHPPFHWQDGTASVEPADLAEAANRYWNEALEYFQGEAWENWFRMLHRNDILADLAIARQKVRSSARDLPASQDLSAALDSFLRTLDPDMAPAQLYANSSNTSDSLAIQFGNLRQDEQKTISLPLENHGSGWISGGVTVSPTWLQIDVPQFGFHDQKIIQLTANPAHLPARKQPHQAQLTLDAGTAGSLTIPIEITVHRPRWYNSLVGRLAMAAILLGLILSALAYVEYRWVGLTVVRFNPLVQGTLRYGILFTSTRDGNQDIYRFSSRGTQRITYTSGQGESWWPVPDPKGGVLFTSNRDGKREIYRLGADGTQRITFTPGDAESWFAVPELSGGLLFTSNRDGKREIYRLTKSGEIERVTTTPGQAESWGAVPLWNGDILFTSNQDGKAEIYRLVTGETAEIIRITDTPGEAECISPVMSLNGDIYFTSNRDGQWDIYRLSRGQIIRVTTTQGPTDAQSWVAYPELGGNMLFSSNRDGKSEIYRLIDGDMERVTTTPGEGGSYFTPVPQEMLLSSGFYNLWRSLYATYPRSGS